MNKHAFHSRTELNELNLIISDEPQARKERFGTETQLQFGRCCLTFNTLTDGVASPSGRLYEKETIYEYLANETEKLRRARREYEKQKILSLAQPVEDNHNDLRKTILSFQSRDTEVTAKKIKRKMEFTKKKPEKRPRSPFSHQKLKVRDLTPITINYDSSGNAVCAISRKIITYQRPTLLLCCSKTVLSESLDQLKSSRTENCPLCSKRIQTRELLPAKTGFSSKR
eukprot:maker-scaffold_2-snap-gene-22.35-mRNA-1 protein AED:0.03 eAED:0.03 QI:54/1/1/1/0.66/0.5/4/65/226